MNNSIIEHRANYHYIQVCEEYLLICSHGKASPHCKALILSVLEQWTNTKRDTKQPLDSIYMTYPLWEQSLYYLYSRSTIIECLGELEEEKKISRKVHRLHGKDTFVYALNTELIQGLIKALPDKGTKELLPHLDAFKNRRVQKQTRPEVNGIPVQKQTGNASKIKRNVSSNISSSTTSEDTYDADASLPHVFSDDELSALLTERGYSVTKQPDLSTPASENVDKSPEQVATCNPIASDTPEAPTQNENGSHELPSQGRAQPEKKPRAPRVQKPEKVTLTPQGQAFYDLYCSMPWIKIAPEITEKVGEQCEKLGAHLTTQEQLFKLRTFMSRKPFFKGKGFTFGLLVLALNDYASEQEPIDLQKRRDEANKNTPSQPSDAEKEAKIQECKAALARLKEQERLSQVYPGRMGA